MCVCVCVYNQQAVFLVAFEECVVSVRGKKLEPRNEVISVLRFDKTRTEGKWKLEIEFYKGERETEINQL